MEGNESTIFSKSLDKAWKLVLQYSQLASTSLGSTTYTTVQVAKQLKTLSGLVYFLTLCDSDDVVCATLHLSR